jgi:hypothetical protein
MRPTEAKQKLLDQSLRSHKSMQRTLAKLERARARAERKSGTSRTHTPPSGFLIDLLVPPKRAGDMLLALYTAFEDRWLPKYGASAARRLFLWHSLGSIAGFWLDWIGSKLNVFRFFAR